MAPNLALIAIPAYYILSVAPHTYAITIASQGQPGKLDNRNPRSTTHIAKLRETLGEEAFNRFERAESAHKNSMENMPLFIAAVFAGLLADQATKGTVGRALLTSGGVSDKMKRFLTSWFAIRGLYTAAYITTSDNKYSVIRSLLWVASLGVAFEQIYSAAKVLGA